MRDQYQGIVLTTYDQGEADVVASLFTLEEGKVFVKARGAKKITAKLGPHLQPLSLVTVSVVAPVRSTLPIVIGAEAIDSFPGIRREPLLLAEALAGAGLVDIFTEPGEALKSLYVGLAEFLQALDTGHANDRLGALEKLAFSVLSASGLAPEIHHCARCGRPIKDAAYFSNRHGGVLCPTCAAAAPGARPVSAETIALLKLLTDNTKRARLRLSERQARGVRALTRQFLEYVAPRPLYVYQFLALF